jgi:hypothetical protein
MLAVIPWQHIDVMFDKEINDRCTTASPPSCSAAVTEL